MSIELVVSSNHLILCRPLLLLSSIFPSIRVFSNESVLHIITSILTKCWSFSFNISLSNEHSGLISLSINWLDLLLGLSRVFSNTTVQKHQFLGTQLSLQSNSHPYMTSGKTLTRRTFVGKVLSLLLNMLSRLVITFLLRSKRLLISWLQSPSAVIFEPPKIKSRTVSTVSPSISHEVMGPDAWSSFSECWALSQLFHFPLSLSSRGFFIPLHFLP